MRRLFRSGERGQAFIEFAFIAPVIMVLVLVIVDFGIGIDKREMLQHAVFEGARDGAVNTYDCDNNGVIDINDIKCTVVNESGGTVGLSQVSVCYQDSNNDGILGDAGDNLHVQASYDYRFTMGSAKLLTAIGITGLSINMTPHADMTLYNSVVSSAVLPSC